MHTEAGQAFSAMEGYEEPLERGLFGEFPQCLARLAVAAYRSQNQYIHMVDIETIASLADHVHVLLQPCTRA